MTKKSNKKYLFICGCARSGTTSIWKTVSGHSKIVIGVERYIHKVVPKFKLATSLFEKERFFDIQKGDSHWKSFNDREINQKRYTEFKSQFNDCIYVGDKIPKLYQYYKEMYATFPNLKMIFIYRNIIDVAQSFKARFIGKKDGWDRDVKQAIVEWNTSLQLTLNAIEEGYDILPINYEDYFYGNFKHIHLSNFLDLKADKSYFKVVREQRRIGTNVTVKDKKDLLTPLEKKYILNNAHFFNYKKLEKFNLKIDKTN